MSRLEQAWQAARDEGRAALVIYLCAGDREASWTVPLMTAAARAGADVIELGVPFSDPTADGPTIQRATERALKGGMTMSGVLQAVDDFRVGHRTPVVLFGYYNPILAYGEERLCDDARNVGADGFLVVDLPHEECDGFRTAAVNRGLDYVPLVAPTTTGPREAIASARATSFIYYVSLTGVTGATTVDLSEAAVRAQALSKRACKPVAMGFGIKTPDQASTVASRCDGVVVGSAVVERVEQAVGLEAAVASVSGLVTALRKACARTSL